MGKIFCVMGKSSSGKDTIYKRLMRDGGLNLLEVVPGTTRPIREGETPGVEYHFYTEAELEALEREGKIIELRSYHTVHGIWKYFTMDDGHFELGENSYLLIATLESYTKMQDYFGKETLVPIYIQVEDGVRLHRALDREQLQTHPGYAELCRRFLADEEDFSEEKLENASIQKRFNNKTISKTVEEITAYIRERSV